MKSSPVLSTAATSLPTADAAGMRTQNSTLVLRLLWRERQISRADIARHTGLSPSTVSAIVTELEQAGLVREIGAGTSRGGRRPVLVGFRDDAYVLLRRTAMNQNRKIAELARSLVAAAALLRAGDGHD